MQDDRERAGPAATSVRIRLLGGFGLVVDGRRVEAVRAPRLESLIAYLALHRAAPTSRSEIAFALWPDSSDAQALTNLRRELHALRRALPDADRLLATEHRAMEWSFGPETTVDVAEFEAAVERWRQGQADAAHDAVRLYGGDLLPACYDDWIAPERDSLRGAFFEVLEALAVLLEERREYGEASRHLRRLVQLDPLHERAYLALMRIAGIAGDRTAGLQAYHACVAALRRELGVEPSPEIQAAYQRLLSSDRSVGASAAPGARTPRPASSASPRLVGRVAERRAFVDALRRVSATGPLLLLVSGEAGIGKTRLLEEEVRWAAAQEATAVYTRSYAAEGGLAYGPVVDWLRSPPLRTVIDQLEPVWQSEIARLVPELRVHHPGLPAPRPVVEGWQRRHLFEALVQTIQAARGPVLLALDDSQWADQDTLEWLHYLARSEPAPAALLALGARSDEWRTNASLTALLAALRSRDRVVGIELSSLGADETGRLAEAVSGHSLDAETRARLYRETDGHPLFIVEMARAGLADVSPSTGEGEVGPRIVPPRIHAVIAARLENLSPVARDLLEVASAVGRDFNLDLLSRASDLEEPDLVRGLDELWMRGLIREHQLNAYDIRHDRIRDVAYEAMSPIRRRLLHRRIGQALEVLHAGDLDPVAAHLAGQYEAAGLSNDAIRYFARAGAAAAALSANREAIRHFDKALAILRGQPPSRERDRREMRILLALPEPINAALGFSSPELEAALTRIAALARVLGEPGEEVGALSALGGAYFVRGAFVPALEIVKAALSHIDRAPDYSATAEMSCGWPLLALGQIEPAIAAFERALASFDPTRSKPFLYGFDAATFASASLSHALWLAGRRADAVARSTAAVERADASDNPHLQAMAHAYAAVLHQLRGALDEMRQHAETARDLCRRYDFAYYGEWGDIVAAWADRDDPTADSVGRIERALDRLRTQRAEARRPYWLALFAEAHLAAGRSAAAEAVLGAALATAHATDDRWWLPEIHRLLGELRPGGEGERHLEIALELARAQGSRSLALRAAVSLTPRAPAGRRHLEAELAALPELDQDRDRVAAEELLASPAPA